MHARMKKSLKMMRDANNANREAANAMAGGHATDDGYMESISRLMEGVKERMLAWDESLSPIEVRGTRSWVDQGTVGGRH